MVINDKDYFVASVLLTILIGFGYLLTSGIWMIVEKKYCKKCGYETLHRSSKPDYWSCIRCSNSIIEKVEIREEDIDYEETSYYLYVDGQYIYFNDMISANVTAKEEIKKLLNGNALRTPLYRVKK